MASYLSSLTGRSRWRLGGQANRSVTSRSTIKSPVPKQSLGQPPRSTGPVIGFMTANSDDEHHQGHLQAPEPTMKQKMMATTSFEQFQAAVYAKPMLRDDWLEFTSRPWVQGPIDTFFANKHLAAVTAANPLLAAAVDSFILAGDAALQEGGHVPWLLHAVQQVAGHPGVYITAEAVEAMMGPHHIARVEALATAALTRPRALKLVAVIASLLTPQVINDIMAMMQACFTDERINRLMDAAEFVLTDKRRLTRADLALEQLSNAVTDDGILHLIATLDAAADLELLIRSGQQLLGWLLAEPVAMGQALGQIVDEVTDMERLKIAVQRNDEVMTLERILKMHKVLAQLSPAASTDNISAATSTIRSALASGQMQNWATTVSQHASSSVSLSEGLTWWASMDKAVTADVVVSLLHVAEEMLDGGRIWALLGQPQPMFEQLLVTDEEARAATCRSSISSSSSSSSSGASFSAAPTSSNDSGDDGLAGGFNAGLASSMKDDSTSWGWGSSTVLSKGLPNGSAAANRSVPELAAAAAAAAADAAATAAAASASMFDVQDDSHVCPASRMFAAGAGLSDAYLQQLIEHNLAICRQANRKQQRLVASHAAHMLAGDAYTDSTGMFSSLDAGFSPSNSTNGRPATLQSSHMWELNQLPVSTALYGADEVATDAAAAAVAMAAAASSSSMCSYSNGVHEKTSAATAAAAAAAAAGTGGATTDDKISGTAFARLFVTLAGLLAEPATVEGLVAAARAVMHPERLPQLLSALPELLAPQRVAIALALLDSALKIGEHEVPMGPTCDVSGDASAAGVTETSQISAGGVNRLLLALLKAAPQGVLDAAAAAAAEMAVTSISRQQLLHAVDTVLAKMTVAEAARVEAAGDAAANNMLARVGATGEVMMTQIKLNAMLAGDVAGLWWAFHVAVAKRMRFRL